MELNKLVFGGLALGCMAAAAGGGYLAARQSPAEPAAIVEASLASEAGTPVTESEGVIAPAAAVPAPVETAPVEPIRAAAQARRETAPRATAPAVTRRATDAAPTPTPSRAAGQPSASTRDSRNSDPAPPAPATTGGMWETRPTVTPERAPVVEFEPEPPAPAAPEFLELVIPSDAVLGVQIERTISSETARVEDRVEARVTRDVRVGDRVAIPAGSLVQGSVSEVDRGGKVRERARLAVRFHTVVLGNGTRLNIRTDSVVREGASPSKESAAKIGGAAVGGAILGAILGGGKGAIIGGATGAAGGTAATMAGDRNPAVLTQGTTVTVRMQQPVTLSVEK
jgi:hypothetical protein